MKKELINWIGFFSYCYYYTEDGNKDELVNKLIFFPGQHDQILNIDESEVLIDGTSKLVGGWSIAETINKSGYSAIFIGCSTTSG